MRKYLFILLLPLTTLVRAQTILEDQFQFNFLALNPAFAGARETFSINAMLGNQFNGSLRPQQIYQLFSTDGAIQQGRGGLALQAYNSNIVGFNNAGAKVAYAYRKKFGDIFSIGLGVDAGFIYQPTIVTGQGIKQMFPYAGLGGLLNSKRFFLSLSKPVLFIDDESLFSSKKPFYTMVGASLGDLEGIMFNLSGLLESNKNAPSSFFITAKAWFKQKVGLGIAYRSQEIYGVKSNKIVPMAEVQVSNGIRLGLSYDPKPAAYPTSSSQTFQQRGILQIYFRYEGRQDGVEDSRLKYY